MKTTRIHTTKKLEKLIKKIISTKESPEEGVLGKWNATVFYINRKKCWLLTNGRTKYNLILPDIKSEDLKNIQQLFTRTLYEQLFYDGVTIELERLTMIIGELQFFPTDNDRSNTAYQNHRLLDVDWRIQDIEKLDLMSIREVTNQLNDIPIQIGAGRKMSDYTTAIEEIKKVLGTTKANNS